MAFARLNDDYTMTDYRDCIYAGEYYDRVADTIDMIRNSWDCCIPMVHEADAMQADVDKLDGLLKEAYHLALVISGQLDGLRRTMEVYE